MSDQLKLNRRIILIIFALSVIPFFFAWILKLNPGWLGATTNKGDLINPPVTTERREFIPFDEFSRANLAQLSGHWIIINVITEQDCNQQCQKALFQTRQLRLMLNKDLVRTRRLVIVLADVVPEKAALWWQDDRRLLRVKAALSLRGKLEKIAQGNVPAGMLLLMDPLGNLMMKYAPGFDPYHVKKDLQKLLKISQIG